MTTPRKHFFLRLAGVSFGLTLAVAVLSAANSIFAGGGLPTGGSDGNCLQWLTGAPSNAQWSSCGSGNLPSSVQGDMYYASAVNTPSTLAKNVTATRYISNTGASNNPAWAQVDLTNGVTGALPFANGGTGLSTAADDTILVSSGSAWVAKAVPDCQDTAGNHLNYTASSNTVSCGTSGALASIANNSLYSNISGGAASPTEHTISATLDSILGSSQGNVAYRNASGWVGLAAGTSGQFLKTLGAGANPAWANVPGAASFYQTLDSQTNVFADSPVTVGSSKGIYYCNAASGNITYNLPAVASSTNFIFTMVKIDSSTNNCTLDGSGVESINGASTYAINSQYSGVTIHTTGSTGWTSLMTAGVSFPDPLADKILYFQNSSKSIQPVTVGSNLSFSGGTLDATVGASSTNTFTNKTLDVEATGNVVSMPFYMLFNTAACQGTTASNGFNIQASGNATVACNGSTIIQGILTFPDASTTEVQVHIVLPADWDSALTTDLVGKWRTSATSGNVVWQVSGKCMADGVVIPTSYNSTADTVTDAAKGTTLQANTFTLTLSTASNHALNGCSAGDDLYLRFFRDPSNGSDTLGADADLLSLALRYRRTM